jgi:hypothetical protein
MGGRPEIRQTVTAITAPLAAVREIAPHGNGDDPHSSRGRMAMSHELKELTPQEIELVAGGDDRSPAQAAEHTFKITNAGHPSAPEQWEQELPFVFARFYRPRIF